MSDLDTAIASANPRRAPLHPDISEEMITTLVRAFYGKVRADDRLGPIFNSVIGDKWDEHLPKMDAFWSSVTRMSGRYKGQPMIKHVKLKQVKPEDFDVWLRLFGETADELLPEDIAPIFKTRAQRIAESLKLGMFFVPMEKTNDPTIA